jgi:hypothetical protein
MKTSIFINNDREDTNECGLREAGGYRAIGLQNVEDELIQDIDEQGMSPEKILASRFLTFLGNRQISLTDLFLLPEEEQQRLKKEFLENN